MKKQIIIIMTLLVSFISDVSAIEKYITDDAVIYLRRGPSTQYGFAGTVRTGEKVNLLESDGVQKYSKIEYSNGRTGWIETSKLNDQPGMKERISGLETELEDYKNKFDNPDGTQKSAIEVYVQKLKIAEQQIADLTSEKEALQKQVSEQTSKIEFMSIVVDEKQQSVILKWFLYGGALAFAGLILGLILPHIITTRRQRRWMH